MRMRHHHHHHHHHKPLPPNSPPLGLLSPAPRHYHEQPPEPATIHSRVINTPAFGEPISPSIAITTTVVVLAPPVESNTTRPRSLSGNSTTTSTGFSMRYLQPRHTSHIHTRNRHLCASHTAPRGWWRKELERRQKQKEESTPVKEEKRKFSPFPRRHHRSESHAAAAAIQQPLV
jgi:hypothetical protein